MIYIIAKPFFIVRMSLLRFITKQPERSCLIGVPERRELLVSCVKLNPGAHPAPLGYYAFIVIAPSRCCPLPAVLLSRSPQSNEPIPWSAISSILRPRKLWKPSLLEFISSSTLQ